MCNLCVCEHTYTYLYIVNCNYDNFYSTVGKQATSRML